MADIYLILEHGDTTGPHDPYDVEAMLDEGEIREDFYGFTEGMPEWRAVGEALVWARRDLAAQCRATMNEQAALLVSGKINAATARCEVREALMKAGVLTSTEEIDALEVILRIDADLKRSFDQFSQNFEAGSIDAFPAWELFDFQDPAFPRDWDAAWAKAGGELRNGIKVASKADHVWRRLSDFGFPFPPFSFDGCKWVRDIPSSEAREYEILDPSLITSVISPFKSVF